MVVPLTLLFKPLMRRYRYEDTRTDVETHALSQKRQVCFNKPCGFPSASRQRQFTHGSPSSDETRVPDFKPNAYCTSAPKSEL